MFHKRVPATPICQIIKTVFCSYKIWTGSFLTNEIPYGPMPESIWVLRHGDGMQVHHAEEMFFPRSALHRQILAPPLHSACIAPAGTLEMAYSLQVATTENLCFCGIEFEKILLCDKSRTFSFFKFAQRDLVYIHV
jgi:hypothetical protein